MIASTSLGICWEVSEIMITWFASEMDVPVCLPDGDWVMRRTRQFILIGMIVLAAFGAILMGDAFAAVAINAVADYFQ